MTTVGRTRASLLAVLAALSMVAAACGGTAGDATTLLDAVQNRGLLRAVSDPTYAPQSYFDQLIGRWRGFDIDVATEIARRLDVEVRFQSGSFEDVVSGNWLDEWDISVGSVTITPERGERLSFTPPYYYDNAVVAVHEEETAIADIGTDLAGKTIGVSEASTYESYLRGTLDLPGQGSIPSLIDDALVVTYPTDVDAIEALDDGDLDAVISSAPTMQQAIDDGSDIRIIGEPLFVEELAVAFDKDAELDNASLVQRVSEIVEEMHADGTLTELSVKWYGVDLTTPS